VVLVRLLHVDVDDQWHVVNERVPVRVRADLHLTDARRRGGWYEAVVEVERCGFFAAVEARRSRLGPVRFVECGVVGTDQSETVHRVCKSAQFFPLKPATHWLRLDRALGSGYLLFLDGSTLMAQPFDVTRRELSGTPAAVARGVGGSSTAYGAFSVSATGMLAYTGGLSNQKDRVLEWWTADAVFPKYKRHWR
jgi:hypothetical protein